MDVFIPIQIFADMLVYNVFHVAKGSALGNTLNFFVYDTIKILILLTVIIFIVSLIRSYFPPEKTKRLLGKHDKTLLGNFLAALLGIVTPFCSCSAVPLFMGFVQAGIPLGTTFSFLISSPMVNEVALVLLWGLFGWKIAVIYIVSGVVIATVGGWVMGKLKLERWVEEFVYKMVVGSKSEKELSVNDRLVYAKKYVIEIVSSVWIYIVIGVGLGALMHGYAPSDFLARFAGPDNPFAVPMAVLVGIPLYSNAAGTVPIVSVLVDRGMAMGTALAFMMSVTALSLPEFIILKKILKPKLIATYAAIVGLGIIFIGYLFNIIL